MKNLLVLTTAGRLHFLHDAIAGLRDPIDVLVVDDATPPKVGIGAFCKQHKLHFITKKHPKGLTHSWNLAYQFFKAKGYDACILSNDDVRFSLGFSRGLLQGLRKFAVTCPVSNKPSKNPKMWPVQWLSRYTHMRPTEKKANRDAIQQFLEKKFNKHPHLKIGGFNGFCFAFGRGISKFGISEDRLFDGRVNTRNEINLYRRIHKRGGSNALCLTSYVFHWKQGTYRELRLKHSDQLWTASVHPVGK